MIYDPELASWVMNGSVMTDSNVDSHNDGNIDNASFKAIWRWSKAIFTSLGSSAPLRYNGVTHNEENEKTTRKKKKCLVRKGSLLPTSQQRVVFDNGQQPTVAGMENFIVP